MFVVHSFSQQWIRGPWPADLASADPPSGGNTLLSAAVFHSAHKDGVKYIAHQTENYYIPLSCLISNNIDNLLTAGKSLSADKYAFAAVRVMPPCVAMGQAAGVTAALAAAGDIPAAEVPFGDVQRILLENGAYLG